jgi:D-alanyl-D-alanine carboxypeptidase (penicillin-binding protein 5/6)
MVRKPTKPKLSYGDNIMNKRILPTPSAVPPYDPDTHETTVTLPDLDEPVLPVLPAVTGAAAIVIDRASGRVLGSKNPDLKWAPASTTKIMTALLAIEAVSAGTVSLNDTVTLQADVGFEGAGDLGLWPSDTISLRDLLHMTLMSSENDAATAVGTYVGGSRAAFIAMMNARAAQLGLRNTSYVGISGRDPEDFICGCSGNEFGNPACAHYTTARDLAALARVALDRPLFATIVGRTTWTTTTWRKPPVSGRPVLDMDLLLTTTNKLLRSDRTEFYPGAYGVKTGTTNRAGANLVSAARKAHWDVIAVVLGSDADGSATGDRFSDSRRLLNFGF